VDAQDGVTAAGYPGDNSGPQRSVIDYWVRGPGAALIGWGTDGAHARCVRLVGAKVGPQYNVPGMCNNLEKAATGHWTAEKAVPS